VTDNPSHLGNYVTADTHRTNVAWLQRRRDRPLVIECEPRSQPAETMPPVLTAARADYYRRELSGIRAQAETLSRAIDTIAAVALLRSTCPSSRAPQKPRVAAGHVCCHWSLGVSFTRCPHRLV
jgi:hypothetical protein